MYESNEMQQDIQVDEAPTHHMHMHTLSDDISGSWKRKTKQVITIIHSEYQSPGS